MFVPVLVFSFFSFWKYSYSKLFSTDCRNIRGSKIFLSSPPERVAWWAYWNNQENLRRQAHPSVNMGPQYWVGGKDSGSLASLYLAVDTHCWWSGGQLRKTRCRRRELNKLEAGSISGFPWSVMKYMIRLNLDYTSSYVCYHIQNDKLRDLWQPIGHAEWRINLSFRQILPNRKHRYMLSNLKHWKLNIKKGYEEFLKLALDST